MFKTVQGSFRSVDKVNGFRLALGLAISLVALMGTGASAAETFPLKINSHFHSRKNINLIQSPTALPLPRYAEFVKLPRAVQNRYMAAFQAALVELDKDAKPGEDSASLFLKFWISNAEATEDDGGPGFCINDGVVREIKDCDKSLGKHMHDFDTKEDLAPLGESAEHCTGKNSKPCGPAFGFDSAGNLFCSSTNLTSTCAQKSKASDAIKLATVLNACAQNKPTAPVKVVCKDLGDFFDAQTEIVKNLCLNSVKGKACDILRNQTIEVLSAIDAAKPITKTDGKDVVDALTTGNHVSSTLTTPPAECATIPPGTSGDAPAATTHPTTPPVTSPLTQPMKTAATTSSMSKPEAPGKPPVTAPMTPPGKTPTTPPAKTACPNVDYPVTAELTFNKIQDFFLEGKKGQPVCGNFKLPDQSVLKVDIDKDGKGLFDIQPAPVDGKAVPKIEFNNADLAVLVLVSDALQKAGAPNSELLPLYLPSKLLSDSEAGTILPKPVKGQPAPKPVAARGWVTTEGLRIRYIVAPNGQLGIGIAQDGKEAPIQWASRTDAVGE